MHTEPMPDSAGDFDEWKPAECKCRKCSGAGVKYRVWDSSCGGYTDYNYKCETCGHSWWVDGIDS